MKHDRRSFMKYAALGSLGMTISGDDSLGHTIPSLKNIPIGIIGMDTSHSVAFSKYINSHENGFEVTAAYTTVSKDIPSSNDRVEGFTEQLRTSGVRIINNIDELLESTDCILLLTNDGRLHLEQAEKVFAAGKPVFIDKPVAASYPDVIEIYRKAGETGVPMFSSSGTRYLSNPQKVRNGSIGSVYGADTFSPVSYEPSHSELFWYGIHGVELLFTVLKKGCQRVRRTTSEKYDMVAGVWENGSYGTFRGILAGEKGYGGQAFGTEGLAYLGGWEGYDPLIEEILQFFRTGVVPIDPEETLEIYAFMEAASISSQKNGDWVELQSL